MQYPAIFAAFTMPLLRGAILSSETHTPDGRAISISEEAPTADFLKLEDWINASYAKWHRFLGCLVLLDWCGKGESHYTIEESFGRLALVRIEPKW